MLARQIERRAPSDVFISTWPVRSRAGAWQWPVLTACGSESTERRPSRNSASELRADGRRARRKRTRRLLFVSRREAPLGIVYATDAAADPRVRIAGVFPKIPIRRSSIRRR
jgi:ABC-type molybdate transport system substrate-binding protein